MKQYEKLDTKSLVAVQIKAAEEWLLGQQKAEDYEVPFYADVLELRSENAVLKTDLA